ncbi:hypothetical protein F5883DRAFT_644205 [Diaporthe sp. PMI_573]|nr:hypothetical protein F5883DRAFT_644205 [Diaporthaceae sp. PMI_573]
MASTDIDGAVVSDIWPWKVLFSIRRQNNNRLGRGALIWGGRYYAYRTGSRSPDGIVPFVLVGSLAAYAIWPGTWYHAPYM